MVGGRGYGRQALLQQLLGEARNTLEPQLT
jgi:hypothetical protein